MNRAVARGFSLAELMTALAVVAILLGLCAPGLRALVLAQQLASVSHALHASLNLARSEAIKRGARVEVAPSDARDWANGWTVFVDENGDFLPDSGDTVIFVRGPAARGISISSNFSQVNIAYHASGRTRGNVSAQAPLAGTLRVSSGGEGRNIVVNTLGRVRSCKTTGNATSC